MNEIYSLGVIKISDSVNGLKVALLVREINFKLTKGIEDEFKNTNLTVPQITIIRMLSKHGSLKISQISEKMGLANSTVSEMTDRLEKQGILEKVRSKEDRRAVYVKLCDKGIKIIEDSRHIINDYFEGIFKGTSEEDINTILNGLETLKKVLDR